MGLQIYRIFFNSPKFYLDLIDFPNIAIDGFSLSLSMKRPIFPFIFVALAALVCLSAQAQPSSRVKFNDNWTFTKDGQSRVVNLPHDWGVDGPFDINFPGESGKLGWWGKAEYVKHLEVPSDSNNEYYLDIDGAMSWAKVYCNGQFVTEWPYGYASFRADLSPFLKPGDNEIKITLDNPEESSRWYPGGGIYRNVWLTKTGSVGVAHWGTYVTTKGDKVNLEIHLRNSGEPVPGTVRTEIYEYDGTSPIASAKANIGSIDSTTVLVQEFIFPGAKRWSPEHPNLYKAVTTIEDEEYVTVFGIRDVEYKEDGIYIDGVKTFLKGVCLHHDAGALGAVWNTTAWERRFKMLKEMGCNAIRTSHNPPAPDFLELCDRMGFVVMDEFSDTWTLPKKPNGYALLFNDWADKDLKAMIHRDRNHPSVILWSIGNETNEQGYPNLYYISQHLTDVCHEEDPSRLTTFGSNIAWASEQEFRNTMDVFGYNYKPHLYAKFHADNPGKLYVGSETASTISSRGEYFFPIEDNPRGRESCEKEFHVSSYDLHTVPWGQIPEEEWKYEDENPECLGEFVWTGFDYLGEPTPYNKNAPSRSSYFGIIDLAGFPKDRFWLYQARWSDKTVLHVLPHWNWEGREGEVTPVHVYTNCDKVELLVNGKSMGTLERADKQYRLRWDDVVYEPGKVEAIGWKDGKKVATETIRTAGQPKKIKAWLEKGFGEGDLYYIDVKLTDKKGNFTPTADNELKFSVKGPGEILAVDAGDPTCLTPFHSDTIKAFNGLASVIVKVKPGERGKITVKARAADLRKGKVSFTIKNKA